MMYILPVFIFLLLATIVLLFFIDDIFFNIVGMGLISFLSAILYLLLGAVDVALTEAAVGAGISTVLFLVIAKLIQPAKKLTPKKLRTAKTQTWIYAALFFILTLIILEALIYAPSFGDINNPTNNVLYQSYIKDSISKYNVPNFVTVILGSIRAFDTLGEVVVIFTAGISVFTILQALPYGDSSLVPKHGITKITLNKQILFSAVFSLMAFLYLNAFYTQFHGDFGPGGGFQAGVIFSVPYILYNIIFGYFAGNNFISSKLLKFAASFGVFICCTLGLLTMLLGGKFLDYYVLGNNYSTSYHYGLFVIELGIGIAVFGSISLLMGSFYKRLELDYDS